MTIVCLWIIRISKLIVISLLFLQQNQQKRYQKVIFVGFYRVAGVLRSWCIYIQGQWFLKISCDFTWFQMISSDFSYWNQFFPRVYICTYHIFKGNLRIFSNNEKISPSISFLTEISLSICFLIKKITLDLFLFRINTFVFHQINIHLIIL